MARPITCTPRSLTTGQRANAAAMASSLGLTRVSDGSGLSASRRLIEARRGGVAGASPAVISVVRNNWWGKRGAARLTTAFMDNPTQALRREILRHLNLWGARANVSFVESAVNPMVRIARLTGERDGGYWSYVGTEILGIPADEPTMNLEGFTMRTSLSEFRRVVCHEAGHTLGFPHEHMRQALVRRIDPEKAYAYYRRTNGWSRRDVDQQVLTPLSARSLFGTPPDQTSIMCYQIEGSLTRDGRPILGGTRINATDHQFAALIYPSTAGAARKSPRPRKTSSGAATKRSTATRAPKAKVTSASPAMRRTTRVKKSTRRS